MMKAILQPEVRRGLVSESRRARCDRVDVKKMPSAEIYSLNKTKRSLEVRTAKSAAGEEDLKRIVLVTELVRIRKEVLRVDVR
jgi:hypothetical protein